MNDLARYRAATSGMDAAGLLSWAAAEFSSGLVFASSLGAEDQVLTHLICELAPEIDVFTLDTGRLFQESYDLLDATRSRYGKRISIFFPDQSAIEEMVRDNGPNQFYKSVELRKSCCHVRKVIPLRRALSGRKAWIVGLRESQSVTRSGLEPVSWDEANGLWKIAPLASWSTTDVWDFIRSNDVPYHALHDAGYPSIGCAPCTRAVKPGDDERAGRWWWENPENKECGLHAGPQKPAPFGIKPVSTT